MQTVAMPEPARAGTTSSGSPLLLAGTMKGVFVLRRSADDGEWNASAPNLRGHAIYALAIDTRSGNPRLWASLQSEHWGAVLAHSDDLGESWTVAEEAPIRFPEGSGLALKQIWQIDAGDRKNPRRLLCGVEPAALFESLDGGTTWTANAGMLDHPHRPNWFPGGGGLCLHTIVRDPDNDQRMLIAISTGGVYRTDDGGNTWTARNAGVRAEFLPDKYPEFGQCVHKVVNHPSRPERLYLQNHWGLYRSDDWGDQWHDIANGVPSDFGFGMVVHPSDPDCVFIVPLDSDQYRCTPDGRMRVYRTRDGGDSWEAMQNGLPQQNAHETVLRDGMTTDGGDPAGIYVGTRSGKVFASFDVGDSWTMAADGLPPVTCVRAAYVE